MLIAASTSKQNYRRWLVATDAWLGVNSRHPEIRFTGANQETITNRFSVGAFVGRSNRLAKDDYLPAAYLRETSSQLIRLKNASI